MREKKTALKFFTICQYQQEEDYLSAMHAQGWQLAESIFKCFLTAAGSICLSSVAIVISAAKANEAAGRMKFFVMTHPDWT